MNDKMFKIRRNLLSVVRGFLFRTKCVFNRNVIIGNKIRIKAGFENVMHPGCHCMIGSKVTIGKNSTIAVTSKGHLLVSDMVGFGDGNQIVCHGNIEIGEGTICGPNVLIYDHNHRFDAQSGVNRCEYNVGEVKIGKACWIGAGCTILQNVHIGDRCIIGAGCVVTKDFPNDCIIAGNPAKIIRILKDER